MLLPNSALGERFGKGSSKGSFRQIALLSKNNIFKSTLGEHFAKGALEERFAKELYYPRATLPKMLSPRVLLPKGALGEYFAKKRYYQRAILPRVLFLIAILPNSAFGERFAKECYYLRATSNDASLHEVLCNTLV